MSLITLIVVLVVVGFLLWAIGTFIPMDAKIKLLLQVVVVIIMLLWVLQALGLLTGTSVPHIRVGH
jgi:hypothetical protein